MTKIERTARFFDSMSKLGFSYSEAQTLRRIELTLQRWGERCCGDSDAYGSWAIERNDDGKPFEAYHSYAGRQVSYRAIPDRETAALKRLAKIMSAHPELWAYHQGDPRGCALYIGRKADMNGAEIDSNYNRGFAVCI